jgi:hypothetical protein
VALSTVTVQPNSSPQLGLWQVVGAPTAWQAVSDGSDNSYVMLPPQICRLDSQVIRLGFPALAVPAGSRIYSVALRRRVQAVIPPFPIPLCLHWFRSEVGLIAVAGQLRQVFKTPFFSNCPTDPSSNKWVNESVFTATIGPDGQPWDLASNLQSGNFFYEMGRSDDDSGFFRKSTLFVAEVWIDVTYQQASAVTVTAPTGVIPDTQPTIQWEYFSVDSQPQQAFQVAVYTLQQTETVGFTPFVTPPIDGTDGFVLGEAQQWTMTIDLTNGQYVAYVQAQATWNGPGTFVSTIGSTTWTRSATGPPPDAVLQSASFDAENNRVALVAAPGGPSPVTTQFTVQASRDGGQSWSPIPSLTYVPAQGLSAITMFDYVAPLNTESQYRVLAYGGEPLQAATAPSNVLSATPVDDRHWLKNPANPLLNTVLPVATPKESDTGIKITKRRMQGTFQLLGGAGSQVLPFVVSGPTYGDEYEIELIFIENDPNTPMTLWNAVDELDRTGGTLLLQKPDGTQLWVVTGPGASGQETQEMYLPVGGNPTTVFWRRRKLVLTQVDQPNFF